MNNLNIDQIIKNALREDITWGDVTSDNIIPLDFNSEVILVLKEDGIVAGMDVAKRTFELTDPAVEWTGLVEDGEPLKKGCHLAKLKGNSRKILSAERVALNLIQRMSGIATLTSRYVEKVKAVSDKVRILDTRKTTPGLRLLEKYSVRVGGGYNHRYNLSDSVLIKDNHLAILQTSGLSPVDVVNKIKSRIPHTVKIEIEVDRLDQLNGLLETGVDTILLDNMSVEELSEAVVIIDGRALTEASGGVTLQNVDQIASSGVDFISVGALTHSSPSLDISLDFFS